MTKDKLRRQLLRKLKQQKEDERRQRSEAIWRKVRRLTAFRQARCVCSYVALPYEVQTWQMIEGMLAYKKRVVVPVVQKWTKRLQLAEIQDPFTDLAPGAFGVLEPIGSLKPVRLCDVQLVLVPGLAFDRHGNRLGHGHGYYDRFLARVPSKIPTVGLAFSFQLLDCLPVTSHDHAVQTVLAA